MHRLRLISKPARTDSAEQDGNRALAKPEERTGMRRILPYIASIGLLLTGCGIKPTPPAPTPTRREPTIRVGLVWGVPSIHFSMDATGQITSHDGLFIARGLRGNRWRVEALGTTPGKVVYLLVAASMKERANADSFVRTLKERGLKAFVRPIGKALQVGTRIVNDNRMYRVCLDRIFESKAEASRFRDRISDRLDTFIAEEKRRSSQGTIRLTNMETGQQFESTKPILVRKTPVTLYNVPVGVGYHWEHREDRSYPATIGFQVDNSGNLAVINIIGLETYLKGVVPSEMQPSFPTEALKAQAVAARSEILSKIGISHRSDPFDVCADVHCQVYSGLSRRAPESDRAVRETTGQILWSEGEICSAVYSAVCGGHGEAADNVWGGESKPYLQGRYDGTAGIRVYGDLSGEGQVRRWIDADPPAYCNTTRGNLPESLDYTKKYFRWQVSVSQAELRGIIRSKTGRDVGTVQDLVPLARGESGRILKLRIIGSRSDFILSRELEIRKALSENALWSSCFYVERKGRENGAPQTFTFHGAGWGHGAGMCQTGAAMMALKGIRYDRILKHYFGNAVLRRLY